MYIIVVFLLLLSTFLSDSPPDGWRQLAPGMDMQVLSSTRVGAVGDSKITIVRIDPQHWELVFAGITQPGERLSKTAREWSKSHNLTAAINAGMFATDGKTHVGYAKFREHINSKHINSYQSVMAFDPKKDKGVPSFRIYDLDKSGVTMQSILSDYNSAIQNLRLIKKPGINVWKHQEREWSEAAIGEDKEGRILFIYSRSPFSMYDLNKELLESGIGVVAAQHLEGGPEAQLYLKTGNVEIEMFGSYETSYIEDDSNVNPWPIPNILGIRPRE